MPSSCFNPRPARRPGAAAQAQRDTNSFRQFQSSPGPKAGRCLRPGRLLGPGPHQFQSSPGPKAGRCPDPFGLHRVGAAQVSILARPEGRALPRTCAGRPPRRTGFNPRPARRPGAAERAARREAAIEAFQSSPGPKAGRCASWTTCQRHGPVRFQSSPGPKAGRCSASARSTAAAVTFQSSPGPKAGRCQSA